MLPIMPKEGTLYSAKDWQLKLANATVHLFKAGFVPNDSTTRTDLTNNECDFTGYAPAVVATWHDPLEAAGGGHSITAPTVQIDSATPFTDSNVVGGYWIETEDEVGPPAIAETVVTIKQYDPEEEQLVGPANTGVKITPTFVVPPALKA